MKENLQPPQSITDSEKAYVSRIRMILMSRAQIPGDFEHVGPENSDEEDQFFKYRLELVDIFKNTLELPGSKEAVLNELTEYIKSLSSNAAAEQIELALFLLFHFAEKVNDIVTLLKSKNSYSDLIEFIIQYPIPSHKIVIKMYLENIVRYSSYFDTEAHMALFPCALQYFITNINSPDNDVKKHTIYMVYRLAIKNCLCLVLNVETVLQAITRSLQSSLDSESANYLYKTIGLIIGNKNISPSVQLPLFHNLCDMISSSLNKESLSVFTEILSGFNKKVSFELGQKLKQTVQLVLNQAFNIDKSNESIKSLCLLLQKLIDTLEDESSTFVKSGLEYLIEVINMETIDQFFQVLSSCCHKIKNNLQNFIPIDKLRGLVSQIIKNLAIPTETITDLAQQSIAVRRSLVKMLDVLLLHLPEFYDFSEFIELINYIAAMSCSFIESSSPKIALVLLSKFIEKIASIDPGHFISQHILNSCYQVTLEILLKKKVHAFTPEIAQIAAELVNLHKNMLGFAFKAAKQDEFYLSLGNFINAQYLDVYKEGLYGVYVGDQKTAHEKSQVLKKIILEIIASNKNN